MTLDEVLSRHPHDYVMDSFDHVRSKCACVVPSLLGPVLWALSISLGCHVRYHPTPSFPQFVLLTPISNEFNKGLEGCCKKMYLLLVRHGESTDNVANL